MLRRTTGTGRLGTTTVEAVVVLGVFLTLVVGMTRPGGCRPSPTSNFLRRSGRGSNCLGAWGRGRGARLLGSDDGRPDSGE